MKNYYYPDNRIAIVGIGGIFPDAENVHKFWLNLLEKKVSIKEMPDSIINSKVFYRPEKFKQINKEDKTYTIKGSMIDRDLILAVGKQFKIPPAVAEQMDQNQHGAIYSVDQALKSLRGKQPSPERTAVIFGNGNPALRYEQAIERLFYILLEEHLRNNQLLQEKLSQSEFDKLFEELSAEALKNRIPITEDTAPGYLQNLIAGRIANLFDYRGPSFTVDAACASSLAAIITGLQGLWRQEYDLVITGGIDIGFNATSMAAFSAINALSPDGSFPFDTRANGFVIGQGGGVVIMKRLEDALRDNDDIIALISGYGQGSDGKGKYIAAPNEEGQSRVIKQACEMAGYPVDTIELMEAHGTGTIVGDTVEIEGLKKAFSMLGADKTSYCGVGSVKSNIGHLKSAAGAAAIIKTAMALHHKILPPTAGVQEVNPKLQLDGSPFYILTEKKDWPRHQEYPRRANVSAFGFGGANYHITMEEYRPEFYRKIYSCPSSAPVDPIGFSKPSTKSKTEVILLSGESLEKITQLYHCFLSENNHLSFSQKVFLHNAKISSHQRIRLAILASSPTELMEKWSIFEEYQKIGPAAKVERLGLNGIFYGQNSPVTPDQVALLFPGQGSQYPNMGKEVSEVFPLVQSFYAQADAFWQAMYDCPITSLMFGDDEATLDQMLKDTKNTHPAIFLCSAGFYKLLSESGVKAKYMIGHSLGEITALFAGEMLDLPSAIQLIGARGYSFDTIPNNRRGKMMSIKAGHKMVEKMLSESGVVLHIANLNSPEQTVVGGADHAIDQLDKYLTAKKIVHTILNVSHAFHTPLIEEAADDFYRKIKGLQFSIPRVKIVANHLQNFYPQKPTALMNMIEILKQQITAPVRFGKSIKMLYEKGVRVFIEVGPSTVLTNLVNQTLNGKDVKTIATNRREKKPVEVYYQSLAELFVLGVEIRMVPSQTIFKGLETAYEKTTPTRDNTHINSLNIVDNEPHSQVKRESLVYSGVSIGLPGSFKKVFDEDNFNLLCEGKNFIEQISDDELHEMLNLNITRLIKNEETVTFKQLSSINDLIRLASRLGELDMLEEYLVDERTLKQMTTTICAGVAAGYEALRDAGIPLVQEWVTTSSGKKISKGLLLPQEMRNDTGIIYGSCFTMIEPFIQEVSKYIAYKYGNKTKHELTEFYNTFISKINEPLAKTRLTDWFTLHYSRLNDLGEEGVYQFNNDFLTQFSSLANNRLAQFIGASGPNFQMNAACSTTACAVTVAESLIRSGQARRVIVVGADNATSKTLLPWIGGGFLTSGAVTSETNIYNAAIPFDNRRNGMILGAGAVGIVIEKEADVEARGMKGICRLLGTHSFNMAGHQSRLDSGKFTVELDRFITKMEQEHQIDRKAIANRTLYFSHETYTPKKGGCSQTEKIALETVFGEKYREILVTNSKGMTGHAIGASIEEAIAAKSLQYQKAPPVVNHKEPDPELEGLRLSKGGSHSFDYALRMIAGFGGQGNYILMQKCASGDDRICDKSRYHSWLEQVADSKEPILEMKGRILTLKEKEERTIETHSSINPNLTSSDMNKKVTNSEKGADQTPARSLTTSKATVTDQILEIYSTVTKYPKEMLDLNMEIEADLGIDTVKQATIFAMIAEKFQFGGERDIQLSNYTTIGQVIALIMSKVGQQESITEKNEVAVSTALAIESFPEESGGDIIVTEVLKIISEVTKYPMDMLDLDMEMEADLGIDTVKQATIISYLTENRRIPMSEVPQISSLPTIRDLVSLARQVNVQAKPGTIGNEHSETKNTPSFNEPAPFIEVSKAQEIKPTLNLSPLGQDITVETVVLEIIAEVTKYPPEMLELEMEMEADLGIDTVKQATIFSILGEHFGTVDDQPINISEFKTVGAVIDFTKKLSALRMSSPTATEETSKEPAVKETTNAVSDQVGVVQNDLSYQVPVAVEAKLPPKDFSVKGKNVWIIGDNTDTVTKIASFFAKDAANIETYVFTIPTSLEEVSAWSNRLTENPEVLIDCGDLGWPLDFSDLSQKAEQELLYLNSEARFQFFKAIHSRLSTVKIRIICTVAMDGELGYAKGTTSLINPYSGALSGFYKGLRKEWNKSLIKIVDLNLSSSDKLNQSLISKIIKEIETGGNEVEIGYSDKTRKVIKLDELDQGDIKTLSLPKDPHFLITGGANGITAEISLGLARQTKGKYTLIGRTLLPENIAQLAVMDENLLNQYRNEILNRLKSTEPKVTPLMVQIEFDKLTKALSAYHLIERIKKTGSKVLYLTCDVRTTKEVQTAINQAIKEHGPIHGLIHGAGAEKSHLLPDKSVTEFQEVFSVKANGLCNLLRMIDLNQLKVLIGFSSISGRFGNEAQLDYCAANNLLSSYLRKIKSDYPDIHTVSIAWSGWKDVGMAWRNDFVKNNSEAIGINLIEPARGVQAMIKVLNHSLNQHEVIVSKGVKGLAGEHSLISGIGQTPLIDWVTTNDKKIEKAYKVISVKRDPLFDHHRLGATPLVPAVGMMEIGAEYHRLNFGPKECYCIRRLSILNPLKLFHDQSQEIFVEAKPGPELETLELSLYSYFKTKVGDPKLICYSKMLINDEPGDFKAMIKYTDLINEKHTVLPWRQIFNNPQWHFSNNINLGSLFVDEYGKSNNTIAYNQNGLVYTYTMPKEQLENERYQLGNLLLNPCLMDTLFQAAAIHALTMCNRNHLPVSADEIGIIRVPRQIETLKIIAKSNGYHNETGAYDLIMIDSNSEICYYARNVMVKRINL